MERNISPAAILCIVLVSLACVIGIGYGAFAITKGSANDGTQEVATQTSEASSSWKSTYNDTEVTGAQVQTLLSEADSRGIAVFVNTRGMTQSKINAQSEVPVLKHNGKYYMNYGTVFDYEDESYKKMSGEVDLSSNSGLLQVRDGSSLKVDYNPKLDNGQIVKNKDYTGLYTNGAVNYIDTHAKFKSNLIYGNNGEVIGVILSQSNRAGVTSLPLSSGGGSSVSGGTTGGSGSSIGNSSVAGGNIPLTPSTGTGGGSSVDGNTPSGGGGNSTEGGTTGGNNTGGVEEIDPENPVIYIDNVAYPVASMDTTWEEWIESENNSIGVLMNHGYCITSDYKVIKKLSNKDAVASTGVVTESSRYISEPIKLTFRLLENWGKGRIVNFDFMSNMTWADFVESSYNTNKVFTLDQNSTYSFMNVKYYAQSVSIGHPFAPATNTTYIWFDNPKYPGTITWYQGIASDDVFELETFSIDSVSYDVQYNSTWWQWVDGEYNTCGATILDDGRISINGKIVKHYSNGNDVIYTDEITDGKNYTSYSNVKSFTIKYHDGSTGVYNFDSGMTWSEWVDSDYDINKLFGISSIGQVFDNTIYNGNYYYISGVSSEDLIGNGVTYTQLKSSTLKLFSIGLSPMNVLYEDGMNFYTWKNSKYNVYSDVTCASLSSNLYVGTSKVDDGSIITYGYSIIKPIMYSKVGNFAPPQIPCNFTIDSSSYSSQYGLQWREWVYSVENTDGYKISGGYLVTSSGDYIVDSSSNKVLATDTVSSGGTYKHLVSFKYYTYHGVEHTLYAEYDMSIEDWVSSSYNPSELDIHILNGVIVRTSNWYILLGTNYGMGNPYTSNRLVPGMTISQIIAVGGICGVMDGPA